MRLRNLLRLKVTRHLLGAVIVAGATGAAMRTFGLPPWFGSATAPAIAAPSVDRVQENAPATPSVELTSTQLQSFKIEFVGSRVFPVEDQAVGSIDFNQDMTTQVFTPYQGRIVSLFAKIGADVQKGDPLFTIDSPDLIQAE